jgi:hypothetical protein
LFKQQVKTIVACAIEEKGNDLSKGLFCLQSIIWTCAMRKKGIESAHKKEGPNINLLRPSFVASPGLEPGSKV